MFIRRIIKKIPKIPQQPIFEPYCEKEFEKLIKDLNITIVSLTIEKKDDDKRDDKKEKERCD